MNRNEVQLILKELNIVPRKHLGQNFLVNETTKEIIINQAEISKNDIILEIGPGLGALTGDLVETAKKVYAVEIDSRLTSFLINKFSDYNNLEIIHNDILEIDIPDHNKVVSNIPYTITGPILEKVFFKKNPPHGILTIERSIANRIFSQGTYKNSSRITISVNTFMKPIKKQKISRNSFYPIPKVNLALINLSPRENIEKFLMDELKRAFYLKILGGIMPFKNKNLANALELFMKKKLKLNLNKRDILKILEQNNIENNKVYSYKVSNFVEISKIFYEKVGLIRKSDLN